MENNTQPTEDNLHDLLNQATETKEPSKTVSSHTWNIEDAEVIENTPAQQTNTETEEIKPVDNLAEKKVTDKAKRASARTAVNMLDLLQKSLFTPVLSIKYKKKFTHEEITKLEDKNLVDAKKDDLHDEDLLLRNKWDRLMKRCAKKIDEIPLTDEEKKDMEEAFYAYFDLKETTLSPTWFIGINVVNAMGKRAIDVFTE